MSSDLGYPALIQSLPPAEIAGMKREHALRYIDDYFHTQNARIYHGSLREFVREINNKSKGEQINLEGRIWKNDKDD
jgi:hypothetical protein